ncbi:MULTISPECIES: hypothetical protein [unclassified Streptomyces]|uniref:hypothetical protein n=1 Tax=unclassified Streptomyces TaxID=2593676 RepID=UPI0008DC7381|nr:MULTISPECIES: hypothetical protein [unclassified Streptomyces]OII68810.1 hypothetical protein BJP39_04800 [Streptomyces sp. CC77]
MAGREHGGGGGVRRRRLAGLLAALLCLTAALGLGACTAPGTAPERDAADREDVQAALDRRGADVLAGRVAPDDPAAHEFANLSGVPLGSWSYRVLRVRRDGPDTAAVRAELGYTLQGHDTAGPVTAERDLELRRDADGTWQVREDRRAGGTAALLWEQGRVDVVRGARSLVLGVGHDKARLREIAAEADRAVPRVADAWPEPWDRRVVVLVPPSLDGMGELLGQPADGYRGTAAVTTGRTGDRGTAPADRVVVNPEAYASLGAFGRRFVLTHETAHVATRAHTSAATPLWLSEGFADWAAQRGGDRAAADIAPALRRAVRAGDVPDGLPADADFAFGGDQDTVARAYEGAWLACALIADRWGEAELAAFYRAVGAHPQREGAVEEALRTVLATTPEAFTRAWQDRMRQDFSSSASR